MASVPPRSPTQGEIDLSSPVRAAKDALVVLRAALDDLQERLAALEMVPADQAVPPPRIPPDATSANDNRRKRWLTLAVVAPTIWALSAAMVAFSGSCR